MLDFIYFYSGGAGWWGAWGTEFLANVRNKVTIWYFMFDENKLGILLCNCHIRSEWNKRSNICIAKIVEN